MLHFENVQVGMGKHTLEAQVCATSGGVVVFAYSPEHAHVGATAQAIARPEPGRSATVSLLAVPCHRDEIPAHDIAAALATRFRMPCVATAGLHVDDAAPEDIELLLANTQVLIQELEKKVADLLCE
ncbi:hypothetical protein [Paratractidigestivibacter sp.]|uniref:prenylated flavin chaperone LpdD n=1 Tax=Paratractidigestivibacter sp. TaxID=2847316 RepID=UPI002ABD767C|nr:hypothetical protein [Paratractidigestivibacter sp.]